MYDRKSPFKKKDYTALFKKGTSKAKLNKLAEKCGALTNSKDSVNQVRDAIFTKLRALKVREPIKLSNGCPRPKKKKPIVGMNTPTFNQNRINTPTLNNINNTPTLNKINNKINTPLNKINTPLNKINTPLNKINNTLTRNQNKINTPTLNKINNTYKINTFNTPKISERKTLFRQGFVPNFIKKNRETVTRNKNYAPVPVAERVSINSGQPVMRAMEAPRPSVRANNNYAPVPVAQRQSILARPTNAQVVNIKIGQRKDLQKHLNSLQNLSVEDVDEYVNRLMKNKSSLKNIKQDAVKQNERYKKRKEEIRKKLKNFQPQMTLTQKSIYNARLNVIPRGKTRSYLNTIEADLLKNMNSSDMLRKRSAIRKEFINVSANKEAIQKKYQDIANKYTGRNREVLNKVYNSLINIRPKLNTNKNTLTKLQVLSMLNRNKRRRDEQKIANKIRELTKSLNTAARANKENEFNKLAKQIFNQHSTRVKSLEEELAKLKNLSQRVATMKERVELQNEIEKAEEQVINARNAEEQAQAETEQIKKRGAKRKRNNNSAFENINESGNAVNHGRRANGGNGGGPGAPGGPGGPGGPGAPGGPGGPGGRGAPGGRGGRGGRGGGPGAPGGRGAPGAPGAPGGRGGNGGGANGGRGGNGGGANGGRGGNGGGANGGRGGNGGGANGGNNQKKAAANAAAAAVEAKKQAKLANIEVRRAEQELEQAKTEAQKESARKNLENKKMIALKVKEAEAKFRYNAEIAAKELRRKLRANAAERRRAEEGESEAKRLKRNEERKVKRARSEAQRNAQQAEREARKAENKAQRNAQQAEMNDERRKIQQLANGAGVPFSYVKLFSNRVQGEVNMNSLKNKANKDREVAKLLGKKNVSFIDPARYNAILESAKKQRFVANRKANGVSMAYLNSYMKASKANSVDNIDTAEFANKFKMDKNLKEKEAVRAGPVSKMSQVKGIFRRAVKGVEYVPKNTY